MNRSLLALVQMAAALPAAADIIHVRSRYQTIRPGDGVRGKGGG